MHSLLHKIYVVDTQKRICEALQVPTRYVSVVKKNVYIYIPLIWGYRTTCTKELVFNLYKCYVTTGAWPVVLIEHHENMPI